MTSISTSINNRRAQTLAAGALLLTILYLGLAYGLYHSVTQVAPGANDFYSRWVGARALFIRGENPYSASVTREIQMGMYGRLARTDEDQVAFAYPLYAAFLLVPLVGLPFAQAQAMWMAFLLLAMLAGSIALARIFGIASRPRLLLGLTFGVILFYPAVRAIFMGQFAIVSFLCLALAFCAVQARADALAGILLAVSTVKPQPVLLLAAIVLLWAAHQRRWGVWIGAAVTLGTLVFTALLLVPSWLTDFVSGLQAYAQYEPVGSPLEVVAGWLLPPPMDFMFFLITGLGLVGYVFLRLLQRWDEPWESFMPVLALAAIVTTLAAGRIGSSDQVLLLIPWLYWVGQWIEQSNWGRFALLSLSVLVLPWMVFIATVRGNAEHVGVVLTLPFLSLIVYLWREAVAPRFARATG